MTERSANAVGKAKTIWLDPQAGLGTGNELVAIVPSLPASPGVMNWVHVDHLGASQKITSGGGGSLWEYDAGPYGELETITNPTSINRVHNLRLPGQYADTESGYRWNGFRIYDPSLGRYLQSDPIGLAGGLNAYAYANDNPVNAIDPWGLVDINLYPSDQMIHRQANLVNPSGAFSVGGHGTSSMIRDPFGKALVPADLAGIIAGDPSYIPRQPVALYSCNVGRGERPFAKDLAVLLGAPVLAPNDVLWFHSSLRGDPPRPIDVSLSVGQTVRGGGSWIMFVPGHPDF